MYFPAAILLLIVGSIAAPLASEQETSVGKLSDDVHNFRGGFGGGGRGGGGGIGRGSGGSSGRGSGRGSGSGSRKGGGGGYRNKPSPTRGAVRPSKSSIPAASSIPRVNPVGNAWRGGSFAPWFYGGALAGAFLPLYLGPAVGRPYERDVDQPGESQLNENPTMLTAKSNYTWAAAARVGAGSENIMTLLVNTGSNATWAPASSSNVTSHRKTSHTGSQDAFDISYGSGSVSGHKYVTDLQIAGMNVSNYSVGLAERESPLFNELSADGMLGLAYSTEPDSLMQKLISSRAISEPEFSLYIDPTNKAPSLQFGGHDSSHYIGDLQYLKINASTGYWSVPLKRVDSSFESGVESSPPLYAILDSSAEAVFLPSEVFTQTFPQATPLGDSNSTFTIDCNDDSINPVVVAFDAVNITLNPKDLFVGKDPDDASRCVLGIFQLDPRDDSIWGTHAILGAPFFRAAYTSFTYSHEGGPAVGIAPVKGGYGTSSTDTQDPNNINYSSGAGASATARTAVIVGALIGVTLFLS